jgi:hypothetical protein
MGDEQRCRVGAFPLHGALQIDEFGSKLGFKPMAAHGWSMSRITRTIDRLIRVVLHTPAW